MTGPTEVSYDNLKALVCKLKVSAINAYMKEEGYTIKDGRYHKGFSNARVNCEDIVSLPDSNGLGGGTETHGGIPSGQGGYVEKFDKIRSRIDMAVKMWMDIPEVKQNSDISKEIMERLEVDSSDDGKKLGGKSDAAAQLNATLGYSTALQGTTMNRYRANFLERIGGVMDAIASVYGFMADVSIREKDAIDKVKEQVPIIVDDIRAAFDKISQNASSTSDAKFVVDIFDIVFSAASIIWPTSTLVKVCSSVGIKIFNAALDHAPTPEKLELPSFESAMSKLETSLRELGSSLIRTEREIDSAIIANGRLVFDGKPGRFRLNVPGLTAGDIDNKDSDGNPLKEGHAEIAVNENRKEDATQTPGPIDVDGDEKPDDKGNSREFSLDEENIQLSGSGLRTVAALIEPEIKKAYGIQLDLQREAGSLIGMSRKGPSESFNHLAQRMPELIKHLVDTVRLGAYNLEVALEMFMDVDRENKEKMKQVEEKLGRSSDDLSAETQAKVRPWEDGYQEDPNARVGRSKNGPF